MQDLNDKITGNSLTANEWNQMPTELQNIIEAVGQTLSAGDLTQLRKSLKLVFTSFTELRAVTSGMGTIFVSGYAAAGDGGAGEFYWDAASTATDNDGTIIKATAITTGRWIRIFDGAARLRWFGATGDGVDDDKSHVDNALSTGLRLDGDGLIYGVGGNVVLPVDTDLENAVFKQLTPAAAGDVRTLTSSSVNNITLKNVKVDKNGDGTNGQPALDAGIYIDGGSDHLFEDVEVTGDDIGNGLFLNNVTDSQVNRPYIHDMNYSLGADPGSEQINGLRLQGCTGVQVEDPKIKALGGDYGAGATQEYTRGYVLGATTRITGDGGNIEDVGQGFDATGTGANRALLLSNLTVFNVRSHGIKLANSPQETIVRGCHVEEAGRACYEVSGPSEAAQPGPKHIKFIGCIAKNPGTNGLFPSQSNGFKVENGAFTPNPIGVQFINCDAIDDQGGPTMGDGFVNESIITADDQPFVEAINCRVFGETGKKFNGMNVPAVHATRTVAQSHTTSGNWEDVLWDEDQYDYAAMHDTGANEELVTIRRTGHYTVDCVLVFAANATGERRIRLFKNGAAIGKTIEDHKPNAGGTTLVFCHIHATVWCESGDTLKIQGFQNSGGALDMQHVRSGFQVTEANGYGDDL